MVERHQTYVCTYLLSSLFKNPFQVKYSTYIRTCSVRMYIMCKSSTHLPDGTHCAPHIIIMIHMFVHTYVRTYVCLGIYVFMQSSFELVEFFGKCFMF